MEFLEHLLKVVPYRIPIILKDNGLQFAGQPRNRNTASSRQMRLDLVCEDAQKSAIGPRTMAHEIEHRPTWPNHPWSFEDRETVRADRSSRGRTDRTDEPDDQGGGRPEADPGDLRRLTVSRVPCDSHDQLRTHLGDVMAAYNFTRRLKTPSGLMPYEYICKIWTSEPDSLILDPIQQMPGLNT